MITEEFSEATFNDILVNLNIDDNTLQKQLSVANESREVLQTGLERALIEPDAMQSYLSQLDKINLPRPLKRDELLPDEDVQKILNEGLRFLSNQALAALALNPLAMLDLRDQLDEQDMNEYWWTVASRFNTDAATFNKVFDAHADELDRILSGESTRTDAALVAFDERGEDESQPPDSQDGSESWSVEIPLSDAEWLSNTDKERVALLREETLTIEFTWQAEPSGGTLVVRPGTPLLLTSDVTCIGRLFDADGKLFAEAEAAEQRIAFQFTTDEWNRATTFQLDYDRAGKFRVRCDVPLGRS